MLGAVSCGVTKPVPCMQRPNLTVSIWASSAILVASAACAADSPPDIEGVWTAGTLTPFERPAGVATHLPEADRAEQQRIATEKFWAAAHNPADVGRDNDG